jgi:hypothetical protein
VLGIDCHGNLRQVSRGRSQESATTARKTRVLYASARELKYANSSCEATPAISLSACETGLPEVIPSPRISTQNEQLS